jgi:Domain of unknown function DUF29
MSKKQLEKVEREKAAAPSSEAQYNKDFFRWTQETAELIRQRRFDEVDLEHVAEEIHDMGLRDHREVRSRLAVLLMHLLKWNLQPERRGNPSWIATIAEQRRELELVIEDSPSLRRIPQEHLPSIYRRAVKDAIKETGLAPNLFPQACPYSADQIMDDDFLPEGPLTTHA